jgi:nicotinamide-nucleotide amidase
VLRNTDEATVAMAVTGHLGPDAPAAQDGDVHVVICQRAAAAVQQISEITERLPPGDRVQRQVAAADVALRNLWEVLASLLAGAGREPL